MTPCAAAALPWCTTTSPRRPSALWIACCATDTIVLARTVELLFTEPTPIRNRADAPLLPGPGVPTPVFPLPPLFVGAAAVSTGSARRACAATPADGLRSAA